MSDERAKRLLRDCDEEDSQWYDHAITDSSPSIPVATRTLRAMLAAREEAGRLREALLRLVRRCGQASQLEPLLHDRLPGALTCHGSCPMCSARQALQGESPC